MQTSQTNGYAMNQLLLVAFVVFCQSAFAFDYSAYPLQDIDKFFSEERTKINATGGVEIIMPSKKVSFDAIIDKQPQKCDTAFLLRVMKAAGYKQGDLPPINTCLKLRSARGDTVPAYVQDSVVEHLTKELNVNDKARFFAMYIYFENTYKVPFFLINDFQSAPNGTPP